MVFPATANVVTDRIGAKNAWGFDLQAACSGFIYALTVGAQFIETGFCKKVIVVGADKMSSIVDYTDRTTCILFGDGCGVAILGRASENEESKIYSTVLTSDSTKREHLQLPAGGAVKRITHDVLDKGENWVSMNGQEVFKAAVKTMAAQSEKVIHDSGKTMADVDWFIPHQANLRIIEAVGNRFGFPQEKVIVNVDRYANTSSATVPIALDESIRSGKIKRGDNLLMAAFGAGLTAGAVFLKY
jgi:3-oxoacyl-[acyl-carrier-protein] synthase-3